MDELDRWEKMYMLRGIGRRSITFPIKSKALDRLIARKFIHGVGLASGHYATFEITAAGQDWIRSFIGEAESVPDSSNPRSPASLTATDARS